MVAAACELSKDICSSDLLQKIQAENKGVVLIATATTAAATVVATRGIAHAGRRRTSSKDTFLLLPLL